MKNLIAGYKRRKQMPVQSLCRNCRTSLQGPYCHKCGQNLFIGSKRSFRDLFFNAIENIFVLDSKLLITLKYLLFFPGKLTKEYINGRIVRYVHPSKLFWFITLVFFTLLTMNIRENRNQFTTNTESISKVLDNQKQDIQKEINASVGSDKEISAGEMEQQIQKLITLPGSMTFQNYISTYSPYVTFLLIPFFAFLLYIFYRERTYYYADYLAFALHFHSFIFILFGIYIGLGMLFENLSFGQSVFLYIPMIYFLIASWVVFKPRPLALIGKSILIALIFSFVILLILILFFVTIYYLSLKDA